ncbi:hypothetical protein [uncultured Campylobacter sp.]|uniref:hypothetical protein n=1 Tax=uncultured Campylobacter sp. TaxID=218934 RepID=UPI002619AD78|nr:hypothetical protein [uncultured Campylobacter sp.]
MLNAPGANFISSLRKNFINFANDRIQTKISLYRDMPQFATADRTHSSKNPLAKHLSARL